MKINRILTAALSALLLASCSVSKQADLSGNAGMDEQDTAAETAAAENGENNTSEAAQAKTETAGELSEAEAVQAALADAGVKENEAVFTKKGVETEHGIKTYEFEFHAGSDEYEYEIDAADGSIISFDKEIYHGPDDTSGIISFDEAFRIGLQESGLKEGEYDSVSTELDYDDGQLHYDVSIHQGRTEYSYEIDAYTGEITEAETDRD